jgi:hypothetical protein
VIYDVSSDRGPSADTTTLTQTGIAHNSSGNGMVASRYEMAPKHFVYEAFFSLAFHMDQQASHRA